MEFAFFVPAVILTVILVTASILSAEQQEKMGSLVVTGLQNL